MNDNQNAEIGRDHENGICFAFMGGTDSAPRCVFQPGVPKRDHTGPKCKRSNHERPLNSGARDDIWASIASVSC